MKELNFNEPCLLNYQSILNGIFDEEPLVQILHVAKISMYVQP